MNIVVITAAKRTPIGSFQGSLSSLSATSLGTVAIQSALKDSTFSPNSVDELYMGCVLTAGLGQAPARQASLGARLPESTTCTTINKMCGSGMQAVINASDRILLGHGQIVIAGGMESMSNAPYLIPKLRKGARMGHQHVIDHMFIDGLEDAYQKERLMGQFAEDCANSYKLSRTQQDDFAIKSLNQALESQRSGKFNSEIEMVSIQDHRREISLEEDEQPNLANLEKISYLKPVFAKGGTVTAANSSSISDGAAALVLAREDVARNHGAPLLARIVGQSTVATSPGQFTIAPTLAVQKLLNQLSWKPDDVDLWEVNEAFAVVCLVFLKIIGISEDRLNIRGGACALGHPIGASGARIIVTLVHALRERNLNRGIATVCIGGGEATAIAIETIK